RGGGGGAEGGERRVGRRLGGGRSMSELRPQLAEPGPEHPNLCRERVHPTLVRGLLGGRRSDQREHGGERSRDGLVMWSDAGKSPVPLLSAGVPPGSGHAQAAGRNSRPPSCQEREAGGARGGAVRLSRRTNGARSHSLGRRSTVAATWACVRTCCDDTCEPANWHSAQRSPSCSATQPAPCCASTCAGALRRSDA